MSRFSFDFDKGLNGGVEGETGVAYQYLNLPESMWTKPLLG